MVSSLSGNQGGLTTLTTLDHLGTSTDVSLLSCSLCVSHMSNTDYYVFCKGWDYDNQEEIHGYDGPFATEQEALDFIEWTKTTKHNEDSPVNIWKTGQPELLS